MREFLTMAALAGLALGGCAAKDEQASTGKPNGRYAGIGLYQSGRLWSQLKRNDDPGDPAVANLSDDDMVVVVVDTRTGEVRQCGNLSGHCVGMDPWARKPAAALLIKHLADLEREDEVVSRAERRAR